MVREASDEAPGRNQESLRAGAEDAGLLTASEAGLLHTMKIIKEGNLPSERKFTATCSNCKCHFEFLAKEAEYRSDQRDGDFYEVKCPQSGCGRANYVNAR